MELKENLVRRKVRALRTFYTNLAIYSVVCVACIFVWLMMGAGPFWPIWVVFGCGAAALLQALSLGHLPMVEEMLPFLKPEWEEAQVKILMAEKKEVKKTAEIKSAVEQKASASKPAALKAASKPKAPKKVAPKKPKAAKKETPKKEVK